MEVLKVSGKSEPKQVAGAISKQFEEGATSVELHAIGAAAINQMVKSIIVARTYTAAQAISFEAIEGFVIINVNNEDRTGIKYVLIKK